MSISSDILKARKKLDGAAASVHQTFLALCGAAGAAYDGTATDEEVKDLEEVADMAEEVYTAIEAQKDRLENLADVVQRLEEEGTL